MADSGQHNTTLAKYFTHRLSTQSSTDGAYGGPADGPSWGLIIPMIMIGVFLSTVCLCIMCLKWRRKRITGKAKVSKVSSFHRSYRTGRSARSHDTTVRYSTSSTTPLRSSLSEKIGHNNNNIVQGSKPQGGPPGGGGKFNFSWESNQWKAYVTPNAAVVRTSDRVVAKPLSPIDEVDSPASMKISDLSQNYEVNAQAPFSPYHLMWATPSKHNDRPTHTRPPKVKVRGHHSGRPNTPHPSMHAHPAVSAQWGHEHVIPVQSLAGVHVQGVIMNSPYYPNNNTPTTDCDACSESSAPADQNNNTYKSHMSSQLSSSLSAVRSISNLGLSQSTDPERSNRTSYTTTCSQDVSVDPNHSELPSSTFPSGETTRTHPSTYHSSLPSSIAPFSKQNVDLNNNSACVPSAYLTDPLTTWLDGTVNSALSSNTTRVSDDTSLVPNVGSSNTSGFPSTLTTRPPSMEPSGRASPEDLSKLVDEMSSIRPVHEESSALHPNSSVGPLSRPDSSLEPSSRRNSSFEPSSRIVSGNLSGYTDTQCSQSWANLARREKFSAISATGQDASLYWDNYPLNEGSKHSEQESSFYTSLVKQASMNVYHTPVLKETQYWV